MNERAEATTNLDETHDPAAASWVDGANEHPDFPVQNLPFGIWSRAGQAPRIGVAIGAFVLDLSALATSLPVATRDAVASSSSVGASLNVLFGLPASARRELRRALFALLVDETKRAVVEPHLVPAGEVTMHLPAIIGDYTDFYVGIHHALNVGKQFRPDQPLLPNYKWVPIGYHGRASSIRVSGAPVRRPNGQRKAPDADAPTFGPSRRLDYELEMGVFVGAGNPLGEPIAIDAVDEHVAGLCLLNDWSARDLQAWEYQPLGPFLAKSFQTTISPWVVTAEALAPFRIAQAKRPEGDPAPLPHLLGARDQERGAFEIDLEVGLRTEKMRAEGTAPHVVARSSTRHMYWTVGQIVTHHASNGCDLRPGDLLGTGTLSAPDPSGYGSLLETTRGGAQPIALANGESRTFLEDGDEVVFGARAHAEGRRSIGFGSCAGVVVAAPKT